MKTRKMEALFDPATIALIGATDALTFWETCFSRTEIDALR